MSRDYRDGPDWPGVPPQPTKPVLMFTENDVGEQIVLTTFDPAAKRLHVYAWTALEAGIEVIWESVSHDHVLKGGKEK